MVHNPVILFDGVCNLCNGSVQFIIQHDPPANFRFASLQSDTAKQLLLEHGLNPQHLDSIVLIEGASSFTKSDAVLRVVRHLSGLWPVLTVLRVIPRVVRNWAYDVIARNRYRWFGQQNSCMLPSRELLGRFLE